MSTPTDSKICIKCGTDCAGKPRTKDTQGRYMCRACFDAAKAAPAAARPAELKASKPAAPRAARPPAPSPAPAAAEPDDMDVMSALIQDSPVITEQCPQCGTGMTADSVICTACGYNKETGRGMNLKVERAARDKKVRTGPGIGDYFTDPTKSAILALGIFAGLFALAFVNPIGLLLYFLLAAVYCLAFGLLLLVEAFRQGLVTGLLYLFLPFYALYYLLVKCESPIIKTHACLSILVSLGAVALSAMIDLPEAV